MLPDKAQDRPFRRHIFQPAVLRKVDMQHALFTLIKACIKQATLNSHLNLLSVSADIRPVAPPLAPEVPLSLDG